MWYLITSAKVYRMNVGKNEKKKERKEKHTNNELGIILLNQVLPSPSIRTSVWMKSDTQSKIQQTKSSIWISVIRMLIHRVMIENEISNKKKKYLYWLVCSRPFENLWLAVCDDFFFGQNILIMFDDSTFSGAQRNVLRCYARSFSLLFTSPWQTA